MNRQRQIQIIFSTLIFSFIFLLTISLNQQNDFENRIDVVQLSLNSRDSERKNENINSSNSVIIGKKGGISFSEYEEGEAIFYSVIYKNGNVESSTEILH